MILKLTDLLEDQRTKQRCVCMFIPYRPTKQFYLSSSVLGLTWKEILSFVQYFETSLFRCLPPHLTIYFYLVLSLLYGSQFLLPISSHLCKSLRKYQQKDSAKCFWYVLVKNKKADAEFKFYLLSYPFLLTGCCYRIFFLAVQSHLPCPCPPRAIVREVTRRDHIMTVKTREFVCTCQLKDREVYNNLKDVLPPRFHSPLGHHIA